MYALPRFALNDFLPDLHKESLFININICGIKQEISK